MRHRWWHATILSVFVSIAFQAPAFSHPAVFADSSFKQASEQAVKDQRLLLLDFTASWCGPCKKMDLTTWVDPAVEAWIKENAIAIQVDVDQDKETSALFNVSVMPTLLVLAANKEVKEFDRQSGYKTPEELLAWLKSVKAGKSSAEALINAANELKGKGGSEEVQARYKLARNLLDRGQYAQATDEYAWLWSNIPKQNPPMAGVRGSYMASEMKRIASRYPQSREKFTALKVVAEKENRADWITLNGILNDEVATLEWFDQIKAQPGAQAHLAPVGFLLEATLIRNDRLKDIGLYLYPDPVAQLKKQLEFAQHLREFVKSRNRPELSQGYDPFRSSASLLYRSLLSAGKLEKAQEVADAALKMEDSPELRFSMVLSAQSVGKLGPQQLKLLEITNSKIAPDVSFYEGRAFVYSKLNKYELALKDSDEVVRLAPDKEDSHYERAQILMELNRYNDAVEALNQAIKLDPKSARSYLSRGIAFYSLNKGNEAMKDYDQSAQLDPRDSAVFTNKSNLMLRSKKYQEAYDFAKRAIEINSRDAGAYCNRGRAALGLGRHDEAISDLTIAIKTDNELCGGEASYYRAKAYDKVGTKDLAKSDRAVAKQLNFKPDKGE